MKKIKLTQGMIALIDDQDFDLVSKYSWNITRTSSKIYAQSRIEGRLVSMHRLLMEFPKTVVDHINGNGLDNRRSNLRVCTQSQNCINRSKQKNNTSGYKGVYWHLSAKKWMASIKIKRKSIYLGIFNTAEEAALAYNEKAKELFGEFALLNEVSNEA